MTWKPDLSTREEVGGFVSDLLATLPDQLGIDEVIAGCQVLTLPAGAPPKYLNVALGGDAGPPQTGYTQAVLYRGGITGLAVGDYVTVIHLREGNRYEVMGPGGAAGVAPDPLAPGAWLAADAAGTLVNFEPDSPIVIAGGGVITEYATIQAAITAAASCETVLVPPGTYAEDITLKDGVCVKGWGPRDKVRITGDVSIITTASGGWLENVTVVMTDPPVADARSAVHEVHNGICNLRQITIIGTQSAALAIRGIGGTGAGTGTLIVDDIIIDISSAGNQAAYGIQLNLGSYELEMKNFKIMVDNSNGGGIADAVGIAQASSCVIKATEGWLGVTATGAGTATDILGTVVYSEVVMTDGETEFSDNTRMAPDADSHPNDDGQGLAYRFINPIGLTNWTAHFRPGETTGPGNGTLVGYVWQVAAPFAGVPAACNYSRNSDWLGGWGAGVNRYFLAKAGNPIMDILYARVAVANQSDCGIRVDDGGDNNYYEYRVVHVGGAQFRFRLRQRTGGGGVVVTDTVSYPTSYSVIIMLYPINMGAPNHRPYIYTVDEVGTNFNVGWGTTVAWVPARVGLCLDGAGYFLYDWFKIP